MGKMQRAKGRRNESAVKNLLRERNFVVHDLSNGIEAEDLLVIDEAGITWSVECKDHVVMKIPEFVKQARGQAKHSRTRWMLVCKVPGYAHQYLVLRQDHPPTIWAAQGVEDVCEK